MTRVFAAFDLDIRHARVTTIGNQAVEGALHAMPHAKHARVPVGPRAGE